MEIRPEEITSVLKKQIEQFEKSLRESRAIKEAGESDPSERRKEFLARLTAYSIIGIIVALVCWVLDRLDRKKKKIK